MLKSVEGIFRDGKIELLETPADVEGAPVVVTRGLDLMAYDISNNAYRVRLTLADVQKHRDLLQNKLKAARDRYYS